MASEGSSRVRRPSSEQVTGSLERVSGGDHEAEIARARDASFPIALRGYEREAVDAYVARVNRLIADLEASRSPDAAIRRALDRVGEETSGILQRAQETANEITERSRSSADDRINEADREARVVTRDAEDRVRELEADYGEIWVRRDRLLDEVRDLAERLLATADDAEERFPLQAEEEEASLSEGGDTGSFGELEISSGAPAGATDPGAGYGVEDSDDFSAARDETVSTTLDAGLDEVAPAELEPAAREDLEPSVPASGDPPARGERSDDFDFATSPDDEEPSALGEGGAGR